VFHLPTWEGPSRGSSTARRATAEDIRQPPGRSVVPSETVSVVAATSSADLGVTQRYRDDPPSRRGGSAEEEGGIGAIAVLLGVEL